MPELPEVETTLRGIRPYLEQRVVTAVGVQHPRLRWPIPPGLSRQLRGRRIHTIERRGKYLLLRFAHGTLMLHLGMSGSLRVVTCQEPRGPYDHFELGLDTGDCLRLRDPRRFGAVLWTADDPYRHKLLASLGPEPLEPTVTGEYLFQRSRRRRRAVRDFLLDGRIIAGIGNIYANEALFQAGIDPRRPAGKIRRRRYTLLSKAIKKVLSQAITAGGTTLRDFRDSQGNPGYFQLALNVYGRGGQPCRQCRRPLVQLRLGGRSAYYCRNCQS